MFNFLCVESEYPKKIPKIFCFLYNIKSEQKVLTPGQKVRGEELPEKYEKCIF